MEGGERQRLKAKIERQPKIELTRPPGSVSASDFKEVKNKDFLPNTIYALNFTENVTQLQFTVQNSRDNLLRFTYDERYGVIIRRDGQEQEYLDLNLQLGPTQLLYLIYQNDHVYITVGGLSYVDLIYKVLL